MPHRDQILFEDVSLPLDFDMDNGPQLPSLLDRIKRNDSECVHNDNEQLMFEEPIFDQKKLKKSQEEVLIYQEKKHFNLIDQETGKNFPIPEIEITYHKSAKDPCINFYDIVKSLEKKLNFSLEQFSLFIQHPSQQEYFHISDQKTAKMDYNAFRVIEVINLMMKPLEKVENQNTLEIDKEPQQNVQLYPLQQSKDLAQNQNSTEQFKKLCRGEQEGDLREAKKRVRERNIKEVIEKVNQWRNIFKTGIVDPQNPQQYRRLTLNQAAQYVELSKKSLDNYYLQIKRGQKLGFDFRKHENSKIGVLRQYNAKNINKLQSSNFEDLNDIFQLKNEEIIANNNIINTNNNTNNNINNNNDNEIINILTLEKQSSHESASYSEHMQLSQTITIQDTSSDNNEVDQFFQFEEQPNNNTNNQQQEQFQDNYQQQNYQQEQYQQLNYQTSQNQNTNLFGQESFFQQQNGQFQENTNNNNNQLFQGQQEQQQEQQQEFQLPTIDFSSGDNDSNSLNHFEMQFSGFNDIKQEQSAKDSLNFLLDDEDQEDL